ncbi:MAG TPA: hypothetical protein VJ694_03955 [Patescibacteria group bacterium]|nr:hypothetical protein [Patescibacteria group bacterium]
MRNTKFQKAIVATLLLISPLTAHAFLGEFCLPKTFWLLLLITTLPPAIIAEALPFLGRFFDDHLGLAFLLGAIMETVIIWGIFRVVEKILKKPPKPFMRRLSTMVAGIFVIFIIAMVLFTILDAKFELITHC